MNKVITEAIKRILVLCVGVIVISSTITMDAYADTINNGSTTTTTVTEVDGNETTITTYSSASGISDDDRARADEELLNRY